MKTIDEYFKQKIDKISFLELKKGSDIQIGNFVLHEDLPMPILTDTLIEGIKRGNIYKEIEIFHVVEGIIFLMGMDIDFKYNEEYKKLLYEYNPNIEDYVLYKGLKYIQDNNIEYGAIFFRALVNINNSNINGLFNYALSLENLAMKFHKEGDLKKSMDFLLGSTRQLELILDISEDFPLAFYKLGYHYRHYQQFTKAKLVWEKYLNMNDDLERAQEVREQLELIEDDVNFEESVKLLSIGEYSNALDKLLHLVHRHKEWGNVFYLTGLAYKGLGDYEKAIDYFYEALDLGFKDINVYNELGICLFTIGFARESIDIFDIGIEMEPNDYKIVFNRGIVHLQMGDVEKAIEDIEKAHRLNPDDEFVKEQLKKLK